MCSVAFNCIALDQFGVRSAFFISRETQPECLLACSRFNWTGSACFMLSGHTVYKYLGFRALVCVHTAFYLARASQLEI